MRTAIAVLSIAGTLFAVPAAAQTASDTTGSDPAAGQTSNLERDSAAIGINNLAPNDRITRLYRAALGREPDLAGHAYWVGQINTGAPLFGLTTELMNSIEARSKSTGDSIRDAYLWALGREPDAAGYGYWSQYEAPIAILHISDSAEHRVATGREVIEGPLPPSVSPSAPTGWVDAGNGVFVPPILLRIRSCESNDNYVAANPRSSARGGYQFLTSSWAAYGHAQRYGVFQAHQATPAQQDEAAVITWQRDGTRPWYPSRYCWS